MEKSAGAGNRLYHRTFYHAGFECFEHSKNTGRPGRIPHSCDHLYYSTVQHSAARIRTTEPPAELFLCLIFRTDTRPWFFQLSEKFTRQPGEHCEAAAGIQYRP